jgi:hypothetical protein
MTAVAFLGPSLDRETARTTTAAELRPPACQGDLVRAVLDGATRVGLIDGGFERVPAVWHKEILWAAERGTTIVGGASMGALRAAEMAGQAIVGVGRIYEMYAAGVLDADDEVAVMHASGVDGYRTFSDSLVAIRWNVAMASNARVLEPAESALLIQRARQTYYPDRRRELLWSAWGHDLGAATRSGLHSFIEERWEDPKRMDALEVLQAVEDPDLSPPSSSPALPMTAFFAELLDECHAENGTTVDA